MVLTVPMFLPTTAKEIEILGWDRPDIILITGDSYVDSPYVGISLIGKVLQNAGFRTAIIAQPHMDSDRDIARLGEPKLFWGISGGCVDSLVANYTASGKKRKTDDYTPGGLNNRRPDRALIQYANLVKRFFKDTVPIVLGGIEASLRRICHYDFWSDSIRRSILFDAKADFLVYGMGEKAVVELAEALRNGDPVHTIRGLCTISKEKITGFTEIPSFEEVRSDRHKLTEMFHTFYGNNDPLTAKGLFQKQDSRYLVQNPPQPYLTTEELDAVHDLVYARALHPYYRQFGDVKALDTIQFSIPTHRGCYGECSFCAISVHQGRTVRWRSEKSILQEAIRISEMPEFKGTITDAGGPTGNMYGFECERKLKKGSCPDRRCLYPKICPNLKINHSPLIRLLKKLRGIKGVKRLFTASGIRYDLILSDKNNGRLYLKELVNFHVSGQLKIAPEHTEEPVLRLMGKPGSPSLLQFKKEFDALSKKSGKNQFLTYYLMAAHPGCTENHMRSLKRFTREKLKTTPRQVQIFTPTPSTYASLMYHTGLNPFTAEKISVEKSFRGREAQKNLVLQKEK
jgi:uncharacterized radical SAM protein YgiQ